MATMTVSKALDLARDQLKNGEVLEAIDVCKAILVGAPETYQAYLLLSTISQGTGNYEMALDFAQRATAMAPRDAACYVALAGVHRARGTLAEAETAVRTALHLGPNSAETQSMLGIVLEAQHRGREAEAAFRRALEADPHHVETLSRLALFLSDLGRRQEAEGFARKALELDPKCATAANTLGNILQMTVRMEEAAEAYRQAIAASPQFPEAHTNLGSALQAVGLLEDAMACYAKAVELRPGFSGAHSNLLACEQNLPGVTPEALLASHTKWDAQHVAGLRSTWRPHANSRELNRPLRVGFVSVDLGRHPVGYFTVRMLENLDPQQVQTFFYSDRVAPDDITARIHKAATVWRDVRGQPDEMLAERIRADGVDILFDLGGHTSLRLTLFARRPAPVQISWIGYVGTTGLAAMDYVLGDRYQIPEGTERHLRERALRMPAGYVCYDPPSYAPPVGPLPAVERGFVTFASFNRLAKINDGVVTAWSEIMRRVPGSRLVMLFRGLEGQPTKERYWTQFAAHGIDRSRIDLLGGIPHDQMLAYYGQVDLALDSFPYSGGLITCEALWMGVPVVTFPGVTFAGRHSLSHLTNAGFPELVAADRAGYIELAVRLANDVPRLADLRARLRPTMAASPLCDGRRFAADFTRLMREVWARWVEEQSAPRNALPQTAKPRVLAPLPPSLDALLAQAGRLMSAGQHNEALAACMSVLKTMPDYPPALRVLGLIYSGLGQMERAVECVERAISLYPGISEWYDNLGALHGMLGHTPQAEAALRESVRIEPHNAPAWNNLGLALRILHREEEAESAHRTALSIDPNHSDAHLNLGTVLLGLGEIEEASREYRRCLELKPDWPEVHSNNLLTQQYQVGITPAGLATAHAEWEARYGVPLRATWQPHTNSRDPNRRLRLGFVSQDFKNHPAGFLFAGFLESLDRTQVETFCYSDVKTPDEVTEKIRATAGHWAELGTCEHEEAARRIRNDQIDILFDLAGHTAGNRLPAFARKPAPIQISWIGYVGTTGMRAMDYLLADRHQIAPGTEQYYTEKILRMPDGYVCWWPPPSACAVVSPPFEIHDGITFGSFNNPAKVNSEVLRVWAKVLHRVPGSRLVLRYMGFGGPKIRQRVNATIAAAGIDPARVEMFGWSHHAALLGAYNQVDIGLDPFPYSGGVTTCEALWMGVPVITCPGQTFASRHSLSHLSTVGLTETIARDLDEYVKLAVGLAQDRPRLAALRAQLRERVAASPLVDSPRFAANFQRLMRQVWQEWCSGTGSVRK
jgi:predicted O-linked N-acetylglucosamine transferase (SPINDLY family)